MKNPTGRKETADLHNWLKEMLSFVQESGGERAPAQNFTDIQVVLQAALREIVR